MNFGKTSTIKKEKDLNSKSKLIRNKFVILFLKVCQFFDYFLHSYIKEYHKRVPRRQGAG